MRDFKSLFIFLRPYWKEMLLAALMGALTIGSNIGLLATSAVLISSAALHPPILDLMTLIVGVRFFGISRAVFRYLERFFSHDVTFRILSQMRTWFYNKLEPLAPGGLMVYSSGDLLERIVGDVETLKFFYLRVLAGPIIAGMVLAGTVTFLAQFSLQIAWLFLIFFILAAGIPILVSLLNRGIGRKVVEKKGELSRLLVDSIQGMAEIIAFGREKEQKKWAVRLGRELEQLQIKGAVIRGGSTALTNLLMNLTLWIVLVMAIPLVAQGKMAGIYLAMLALGAMAAFEGVLPLSLVAQHLAESRAAAGRLMELAEIEVPVAEGKENPPKANCYELKMENLLFRYQKEGPWVLNLDLHIPAKSRVAVVGPSGAGKSTLVNLLLRFWDYQEGSFTLNGREIKDFSPEGMRELIGVLAQDTYLFNATIRENLLLARPDAKIDELDKAVAKAGISHFIQSLPQGYDTYVGMNGMKLSGGQRQRLALARLLLKDAPIVIMDEPTAGLDSLTAGKVMGDIYQLMEGRTTLVITHHLQGLEIMDKIFVMDKGKIVQEGTHRELLADKGLYHEMWQIQQQALAIAEKA